MQAMTLLTMTDFLTPIPAQMSPTVTAPTVLGRWEWPGIAYVEWEWLTSAILEVTLA